MSPATNHSPVNSDPFGSPIPTAADSDTLRTAANTLLQIIEDENITVEKLVFFGSQITGNTHETSDLDVLIVSPDFEGVEYHSRGVPLSVKWPVLELPPLDFKALTPDEFAKKQEKADNETINAALTEGIEITLK